MIEVRHRRWRTSIVFSGHSLIEARPSCQRTGIDDKGHVYVFYARHRCSRTGVDAGGLALVKARHWC
jgi:hypothetical protein